MDKDNTTESMGVALERSSKKIPVEVNIDEQQNKNTIGPIPSTQNDSQNNIDKIIEPAIALILPDIKDVIPVTLNIMRTLNKSGITPRIYAGAGLGAAMATALAFNLSADEIEWEFFALERKGIHGQLEKAKALVQRFDDKDLSQSFHVLVLPTPKGKWMTRGDVGKIIEDHLNNVGQGNWPIRTPSGNFGADIVLKVSSSLPQVQVDHLKEKIASWKLEKAKSDGN